MVSVRAVQVGFVDYSTHCFDLLVGTARKWQEKF
jgi:hypothetical protein